MEVFSYKPGWSLVPSGEYMVVAKGLHPLDAPYPDSFSIDLGRYSSDAYYVVNNLNDGLLRRILMYCSEGFSTAKLEGKKDLTLSEMVALTTMPTGMTLRALAGDCILSVSVEVPPASEVGPDILYPENYITVQTQRSIDLDMLYPNIKLFKYREEVLRLIRDLCTHEHNEWFKVMGAHWMYPHPEMNWGTAFDNHTRLRNDLPTTDGHWLLSTQSAYCNRPGSHVRYISRDYLKHTLDKGQYEYEYPNGPCPNSIK